jgi:hypothetical protein
MLFQNDIIPTSTLWTSGWFVMSHSIASHFFSWPTTSESFRELQQDRLCRFSPLGVVKPLLQLLHNNTSFPSRLLTYLPKLMPTLVLWTYLQWSYNWDFVKERQREPVLWTQSITGHWKTNGTVLSFLKFLKIFCFPKNMWIRRLLVIYIDPPWRHIPLNKNIAPAGIEYVFLTSWFCAISSFVLSLKENMTLSSSPSLSCSSADLASRPREDPVGYHAPNCTDMIVYTRNNPIPVRLWYIVLPILYFQ